MKLSIRHRTHYEYEPKAAQAAMRLKLFPALFASQKPLDWSVTVNGDRIEPLHVNGNGDGLGLWHHHAPIDAVEIIAEGAVETTNADGVLRDLDQVSRPAMFLRTTGLTKPSEAIHALAAKLDGDGTLARLHALSELVHQTIAYRKGATDAQTAAADAVALGAGVCQDQAHVFISVARAAGIPARYVTGYLFDSERETPETDTHAWAEGFVEGLGWIGFDVTNQLCPTDAYVRLTSGLDAEDSSPIRGVISGESEEDLTVEVAVQGTAQSQSQSQQ